MSDPETPPQPLLRDTPPPQTSALPPPGGDGAEPLGVESADRQPSGVSTTPSHSGAGASRQVSHLSSEPMLRETSGRTHSDVTCVQDEPVEGPTHQPVQRSTRPFPVRQITYYDRKCVIILQEENGPCPLIALCNILSLRGRMDLLPLVKGNYDHGHWIKRDDLTNALATLIMERLEAGHAGGDSATRRYTFTDALDQLPKFIEGMDLNVKFFKVDDYEASKEVAVLDAAGVELVHGWIVDPEMTELVAEVKPNHSYNVMVEKAMSDQAPRFKEWLDNTASQLTFVGLFALQTHFHEGDIKMLFRNNHYSVMVKRNGTLWSLISDAGMSRSNAIWESVVDVEGQATQVVDANFGERRVTPPPMAHQHVGGGGGGHIQTGRVVNGGGGGYADVYTPVQPGPQGSRGGTDYQPSRQEYHRQQEYDAQQRRRAKKKAKDDDCCVTM